MIVRIYHAINPTFGIGKLLGQPEEHPQWPDGYQLVAEMDKPTGFTVEDAFLVSQNVESNWTEHTDINAPNGRCRSTSVGDVIELDGRYYRCEATGWTALKCPGEHNA